MARTKKVEDIPEEANYGKTLLAGLLIIIILIGGYFSYRKIYNKENTPSEEIKYSKDEIKFKEEYEKLNNEKNTDGEVLSPISILEDNNITYTNLDKVVDLIKNNNGVLYIGNANNQKSRMIVPLLLKAMSNTSLEKIYYLDIVENNEDIRDSFEIVKKKAKKTKEASDKYYELLKLLDSKLSTYYLFNNKGEKINTGEKRINIPTVISFNAGNILGYVEGTVDNHELDSEGILRSLTNKEEKELIEKYTNLITEYLDDDCGLEPTEEC